MNQDANDRRDRVDANGDLRWDPSDGVELEVAESVLGDLVGLRAAQLARAEQALDPDQSAIATLRDSMNGYARERHGLSLADVAHVRAVCDRYALEL